jgi:hypothetical protein
MRLTGCVALSRDFKKAMAPSAGISPEKSMTDDFMQRFQYGLSDLPAPPPDEYDRLYRPAGIASTRMPPMQMPDVVTAGPRWPWPRDVPVGPYPGPNVPPLQIPLLDTWKKWGPVLEVFPHMISEFARRRARGKNDYCHERFEDEEKECLVHKGDSVHPDYYHGCIERAEERRRKCIANGGRPHPDEPPNWRPGTDRNPGDEETWRNFGR